MENKIVSRAYELKSKGFTHMASVVKSFMDSTYYNVVSIDDVIECGRWIPAPMATNCNGWHGRIGIEGRKIDWSKTARR